MECQTCANSSLHRLVLSEAEGRVEWIPRLGACGTSLGMTSQKDASLGMSVGTVRLAKNLSRKGGIYPAPTHRKPIPFRNSE